MSIKNLTPYVFFDGTAEKALQLYERTLGAKTEGLQRYGEAPETSKARTPQNKDRVMHACVLIGEARMMVSDVPNEGGSAGRSNIELCLDFDDAEDMARKFEALAATGEVTMALHDTFWGAKFGTLVDQFGIHWMFNCATQAK
ncbi:VOC family protein [Chondromyces crocatus]|uniref:3-demethylubiquinone-9 3-methyltransferase n=1 Tax=Chondromyces crocatus TaxID=52 RepID=A0A0K1EL02_CHOCO|nr:VOC family protein [Chondromyces crocatus]AKT41303.1 3-demethylubiquinone-9 3-methyltransferase [Chondromyces crocatus]